MDTPLAEQGANSTNGKFDSKDEDGADIINDIISQSQEIIDLEKVTDDNLKEILITDVSADLMLKNIIHIEVKKNFNGAINE
jgi:hypothetical protein